VSFEREKNYRPSNIYRWGTLNGKITLELLEMNHLYKTELSKNNVNG
jgi:hypothetical protein